MSKEQIKHNKADQGGPLEQEAHKDHTEFDVEIRDNTQGGYIYWDYRGDALNPGRVSGCLDIVEIQKGKQVIVGQRDKPVIRRLYLREFDQQRWKLHSQDKVLDEILTERACIQMFHERQKNNPIEATKKLVKEGPEAVEKALEFHADRFNGVTGDLKELATEMKNLAEQMIKMQGKPVEVGKK